MKVLHLNHSDINGGAARAAYRIHHAMRVSGVDSTMLVNFAVAGDPTVQGPTCKWGKLSAILRSELGWLLWKAMRKQGPISQSPAILPSNWAKKLNASDADLIHLHWITGEMLSIADIGRIEKPIVWTLHDMWAFCGAEHYTDDFRWHEGYRQNNRPLHEFGFDLNRWIWKRKHRHWRRPIHIVTPSRWLADCVRQSTLMRDWPVSVVPNCLNTERWKPFTRQLARELLGLPVDVPLLLFGAIKGTHDLRKGFDLLMKALHHLHGKIPNLELVIFGQHIPLKPPDLCFPVHYTGHLHDDLSLRALYSAADALVIPSIQDNLPNTGVEAHACGTPVIAFATGGLSDIVDHHRTGYLAKAFDTEDLATGITWVLSNAERAHLGEQARTRAVANFSNQVVAEQYGAIYEQAIKT